MAEKLTPEQAMAVSNRGGKLLVSAAAGSGKTKVLVDRLLSYIQDPQDPANVDDFLIITYTKAAAAELRGKIGAKLTEKIAEQPENRHLQQQIQRLYLAKISTVHSFCSDILREFAYRLDLPADFRVADESECSEIQREVLEKLLEEAYESAEENNNFRAFVDTQGFGRDDRQIPQIILKVFNSARCHLNPDKWLDWCVDACNVENVQDAGQTVWGRFLIDDFKNYVGLQKKAIERCAFLASENGTMPKPAALLASIAEQLGNLEKCNGWDQIASYPAIDYGRMVFPKSCTDINLAEQMKAVRTACKKGIESKLRSFAESSHQILEDLGAASEAAKGLTDLVRRFSELYSQVKKNRRILDFSDLEHKTLDLLLGKGRSGPTAAAAEIGSRFREIMVDEYQDSNAVQDAIFGALTDKRQNCFMVGDVKQSIYQFRLADPGIFIDKYNHYQPAETAQDGVGRKVLLSRNFRSSGGVISAVNDVFTACMSQEVGGIEYGEDEMLYEGIPHKPLPEPEVELYGIQVENDTYGEEAAFAADRIQELISGNHMIRQGEELRPIRPEDIVILLRSPGSVGGEFRYALEQRGIPCTTGDSTDLLSTQEIGTLCALLQIIDNPLQDIPLLAVLASPVFGFSADDLAALREKDHHSCIYDVLQISRNERCCAFMDMLTELRQNARAYTVSQLLEMIFLKTGFADVYTAMADGDIRAANLRAFTQVASNYETTGKKDLYHFLQYLQNAADRGLVVPAEQSGAGAVTIMSIHKSKGLEFPVVLLCGLSRAFNRESTREQVLCHKDLGLGLCCADSKLRVRYPTIAKQAIAAKIMEESISEEMRVLYVAMTRARDRLIMTYAARNLENTLTDLVSRMEICSKQLMTADVSCPGSWVLQTALRKTEAGSFFALGGHPACASFKEPMWKIDVVSASKDVSAEETVEASQNTLPPDLISLMKQSLNFSYPYQNATVTPSKQTATQLKGRQKDQEAAEFTKTLYSKEFRKVDFDHRGVQGKNYGTAVHGVMQYISYEKCRDIEGVRREIERLKEEKLISEEQGDMVDPAQIAAFFSTDLGSRLRTEKQVLREFKFSILTDASRYYENVPGEQVLLQGVVDCALVEEDGITVLDFKTDYVTDKTLESVVARYRDQVLSYADALQRIYQLPIKASYLYFFHLNQFAQVK